MNVTSNSPVSLRNNNAQNSNIYYNVTSPSNSDGNHYQSPFVSPGQWEVSSPYSTHNTGSPKSNASFQGSPNSTMSREIRASPPSTPPALTSPPSSQAPTLPVELGNKDTRAISTRSQKESMEYVNKRFLEKSSMDIEREKAASRRVQSMMIEASRNRNPKLSHKDFLVKNGTEKFATSSIKKNNEPMVMEDLNGSVGDFKCGFDRDREKAAAIHALRILTKLNNAA